MRVILEWTEHYPHLIEQVQAANMAIRDGIKPNGLYGVRMSSGNSYGVKCNAESVRVYGQSRESTAALVRGAVL